MTQIVADDAASLAANGRKESALTGRHVPMDTFRWIVSGLLGTLVLALGWFLNDVRAELREVRKDVTAIRIEAAAASTKLDALLDELRRRLRH